MRSLITFLCFMPLLLSCVAGAFYAPEAMALVCGAVVALLVIVVTCVGFERMGGGRL